MTYRRHLSVALIVVLWALNITDAPERRVRAARPIYGHDDLTEAAQHPDPVLRTMAGSVAALVSRRNVRVRNDGVVLKNRPLSEYVQERLGGPMCADGRFRDQPTPAFCTGFLIDSDLLVTAGHCIQDERSCQRTRFVFDFHIDRGASVAPLSRDQVFQCRALVRRVDLGDTDFAVIRLDRDTGRLGLEMQTEDVLGVGTPLAVIGHPFGLPMKIASGGIVVNVRPGRSAFETTLDTFDSNSGSPVISLITHRVEGLLSKGEDDFIETANGCFAIRRCPADGSVCEREDVVRMGTVTDHLP